MESARTEMSVRLKPVGRPRGICLGPVDHAVIKTISQEGFLSFRELREGLMKGRSRVSIWRRMRRLVQAGILRQSVDDLGHTLGWSVDAKGAVMGLHNWE